MSRYKFTLCSYPNREDAMSDELELFTNPMSRGQIARWMIEETGLPYRERLIAYGDEMRGDAYRAVNPMMKVPAIRHRGRVVTECAAICAYLADAVPEAKLAPPPEERADYYRWLFFAAGPVEQAVTARSMGVVPDERQQAMAGYGSYERMVDVLEAHLDGRDYVAGEVFTAADVYAGAQVIWGVGFGTLPKRPAFERYAERLTARDAYRRAKARDDALIAELQAAG
jgi:glutathione S-transferase